MQTKVAKPRKNRRVCSTVRVTDPALFPLCMKLIELGFFVWESDGSMRSEQGVSTLCAHHQAVPDKVLRLVNNPPHFSGVVLETLQGIQLQAIQCLEPHVVEKIAAKLTA